MSLPTTLTPSQSKILMILLNSSINKVYSMWVLYPLYIKLTLISNRNPERAYSALLYRGIIGSERAWFCGTSKTPIQSKSLENHIRDCPISHDISERDLFSYIFEDSPLLMNHSLYLMLISANTDWFTKYFYEFDPYILLLVSQLIFIMKMIGWNG